MSEVAGRAFDILQEVVLSSEPLGLMELASRATVDKSTASRLLRFLETRELVVRDPQSQRYKVGPTFIKLSAVAIDRSDLRVVSQPYLANIRNATAETVSVHFRIGTDRVCIAGMESSQDVRTAITSGESRPLYLGASGRVIMAFLESPGFEQAMRLAKREGIDIDLLGRQLKRIRARGGSCILSERIVGLSAASAPLFGPNGVTGSITVSGPATRWTMKRMEDFLPKLRSAADLISAGLGGNPPP